MAESIDSGRTRLSWKPRWIVLIGVTLAVLGFIVWLAFRRTQVQVRTARAYRETITSSIATNGKIEPIDNFEAHAPMSATVKRVEILQGDWVKANQLLLQLDDADARVYKDADNFRHRFWIMRAAVNLGVLIQNTMGNQNDLLASLVFKHFYTLLARV